MDNVSEQSSEMEVLKSIFGDQWQIDLETGAYSIEVTKEVKLFISLTPDYPSHALPKYELLAPNLTFTEKQMIEKEFKNLFETECGGPLIYQMILQVEEIAKQTESTIEQQNPSFEICEEVGKKISLEKENNLQVFHGPIITDRKSVFQGHACVVNNKEDIDAFMDVLFENKKIANATHNISAYRILLPNNLILQDCNDDGENKASGRVLELLQNLKLSNIMVVVSRWYGGIHLGPDRFRHICNAARKVLEEASFIKTVH